MPQITMSTRVCSVDGCERGGQLRRRMCGACYQRWKGAGGLGETCTYVGCAEARYATQLCRKHYERVRRHGDPSVRLPWGKPGGPNKGVFGPDHPQWKGDAITYDSAHARVYRQRGSASGYRCIHCDGQAQDWAYDRMDSAELRSPEGWPYSGDPAHYMPLCIPCHRKFDPKGDTGRLQASRTHCPQGHPYNDENTYWRPDRVGRHCRICRREASRRSNLKRR